MPEIGSEFRIPKVTGTHADVLAAVGLADVLADALGSDEAVRIVDEGPAFVVRTNRAVTDEDLSGLPRGAGYAWLKTSQQSPTPTGVGDVLDYGKEKERFDQWRRRLKELRKAKVKDEEIQQALKELEPREGWRHWQILNTLQGDGATNALAVKASEPGFREEAAKGLRRLAAGAHSGAPWRVSTVQLFSPAAGKGYCRLKPDSTSRSSLPNGWCDALIEWFRHRGYFKAAAPQFIGDDVRIYVPVPADIGYWHLRDVARELSRRPLRGEVKPKRDALATLELAVLLIERSDLQGGTLPLRRKRLSQILGGLTVAHYQSLGQARALSETGALALPGWFALNTRDDADALWAALDEHRKIIRGLRDNHSDEIGLLRSYRRFLETRGEAAIGALLEFGGAYGAFVLRIRAQDRARRVNQFGIANLEGLIMSTVPNYTAILQDTGLRAVADAIRHATVLAQHWKSNRQDHREIRYDLLPELRRKRDLPGGAFMEAVGEFIASYNAENARRREMEKRSNASITEAEFAALAALVDAHGPSLVGAMLCALGTCRKEKEENDETKEKGGGE